MQTSLRGIANKAANDKQHRFGSLYRLLNEANLIDSFYKLKKDAAAGVDRVTFQQYEKDLDENVAGLVGRLKAKRYRAKLVKRKLIPKSGSNKKRPLGIPALEDKMLQRAVADILSAIFEQDFHDSSYAYRKGRNPHQALRAIRSIIYNGDIGCVVEADIRGFFDNIDHDWLIEMLATRINDKALIRLIVKWLKAGILEEDGKVIHPGTGTPQGGVVSAVLANIYLHFVLDHWFEKVVKPNCKRECHLVRYADDFVCLFEDPEEGERFNHAMGARMEKFGLELAEEKSGVRPFSQWREQEGKKSFEVLGFEFRRTVNWKGYDMVEMRTSRKRMQSSVKAFTEWIKENRHQSKRKLIVALKRKLNGYWNYYAIKGNSKSCNSINWLFDRLIFKWLNRRSGKSSFTWEQYGRFKKRVGLRAPRMKVSVVQEEMKLVVGVV